MKNNYKFGIANFKPFGEKLQKFNLKPITLIYGPNSIGKSSVVHSVAYSHNLFSTGQFDVSEINLGDRISLGGFSQYIHKKNIHNDIQIEHIFNQKIGHHVDYYRSYEYFAKEKLLSLSFEKIKETVNEAYKNLISEFGDDADEDDWSLNPSWYFDEQGVVVDFIYRNITWGLEEWDKLSAELKQEGWDYKPNQILKKFLDTASPITLELFKSVDPLYVKSTETDDTVWIDFNNRDFTLKLMQDEEIIDAFCHDIHKYISIYCQKEWPVIYNPEIKIQCSIGKYDNEILDKSTNYYVGNEILIETLRIDPAEEKQYASESQKRIAELLSGESENRNRYIFRIHTEHWMVQKVIEALDKENVRHDDSVKKPSIREFLPENIDVNFRGIDSVFLYTNENMYDTELLMRLKVNLEEGFEAYKDSLQSDYEELEMSPTLYDEYDDVYENGKTFELLENLNITSYEDVIFRILTSWMATVNSELATKKANFKYIGPLRNLPERHEFSFSENNQAHGESSSIWYLIKNSTDIQNKLNEWLSSEKLKTPYELKIQQHIKIDTDTVKQLKEIFSKSSEDYYEDILSTINSIKEMSFYDKRYNTPVNIREMGLGVSQVLPILVSLMNDKEHVIAVEQPELHLHPAVQSELADEFIKSYKNNSNISLIETHSEHLLLRIMKRMRQTVEETLPDESLALTPEDVSVLYVDADDKKTYIMELQLDADGSLLDPWPGGFFEEGFSERFF